MMYKIITFVKKRNLPLLFRNKNSAFPASYGADIYFPTHIEAVVPKWETVLRVMWPHFILLGGFAFTTHCARNGRMLTLC